MCCSLLTCQHLKESSSSYLKYTLKDAQHLPVWCPVGRSVSLQCRASAAGSVAVTVEPAGKNAQCLYAGVDISAPVDVIWGALTDYDGLGTFIPGVEK